MQSNAPLYSALEDEKNMSSKDTILLLPSRETGGAGGGGGGGGVPSRAQVKLPMGPEPHTVVCPFCSATVRTSVKRTATTRTHVAAVLCCFICCCCCLPYCMHSAKNTDHYCPNPDCGRFLGTYEK